MGLNVPRHKDPHYWSPVQRCPSPFSAPWQRGCGLRPAQKTAHPTPPTPPSGRPAMDGSEVGVDITGRRCRVPVPRKGPKLCTFPNDQPAAKPGVGPMSQASPSPLSGHMCQRGTSWFLATRECSRFILNVHVPGHPTCHPGAGSCMLGSWFLPLSPTVSPTEALRTPRLAVFTGSPPHTSSGIPSKDPPQPCSQSTRGPPDPT